MKKVILSMFLAALALITLAGCKKDAEAAKVRLNETVHSIFYAPQYAALEKGFFKEEGLDVTLDVAQGSDKCMTALISGNADIALLGPETGIYVYNEGKSDFPITFAQLTRRAGNFFVSRTDDKDFNWTDVKGKTIIGGRNYGMPQMILEYILRNHGVEPGIDVEIVTNLDFTTTAGAFVGGSGDYTVEFEPSATAIENEGRGYVVASLGAEAQVPYTVYMTTPKFLKDHPDIVQKFTNAVYRGEQWVKNNTAESVAEAIQPHFKEYSIADLAKMVERYKSVDSWNTDPILTEKDFTLLQDIMEESGSLAKRVPYKDMINTEFANEAVKNVKID
ncbi:MAG: ABC transporter substrate-binding protein [Clostridiales bacterium]|jgi:NitT/TauT family transport system substrate-binding protein|nr:ABC transporter substrate-binding protein [Clostridiales bacterium]